MEQITQEIAQKVVDTVNKGLCKGLGKPEPGQMCVEAAVCYAMGIPHSDNPPCVSPSIRAIKIGINDANWSSNEARAKGMIKLAVLQLGTKDNFDEQEFVRRIVKVTISKTVPKALRYAASVHPDIKHKQALEEAAVRCETEKSQKAANAARSAAYAAYAVGAGARSAANAARSAANAARSAAYAAGAAAYAAAYAADAGARAAAYAAARAADAAGAAAYAAAYAADAGARADKELLAFAQEIENILIDMKVPGVQWLELIKE